MEPMATMLVHKYKYVCIMYVSLDSRRAMISRLDWPTLSPLPNRQAVKNNQTKVSGMLLLRAPESALPTYHSVTNIQLCLNQANQAQHSFLTFNPDMHGLLTVVVFTKRLFSLARRL